MYSTTVSKIGLLSFASTALAAPWSFSAGYRGHHHLHGHSRSYALGTGTGYPTGTGIPFPAGNGTGAYGSGTGTVGTTALAYSTGYVTVTEVVTEGTPAPSVAAAGIPTSASSSSCSTPTVSTTTTQVLTVMVPAVSNQLPSDLSASTNDFWSVPSISTPADYPVAPSSLSSSSLSTDAAAVATSSSVQVPTSSAPAPPAYSSKSVEAAGFSRGDFSFPWAQRSSSKAPVSSSAAPVPVPSSSSSTAAAPFRTSSTPVAPVASSSTPSTSSKSSSTPVAPVDTTTSPTTSAKPTTPAKPTTYSAPAVVPTSVSIPVVVPTSVSIPVVIPTSSAAPVQTTSSTSAAPKPSSTYTGSSGASKRGIPYNDAALTDCFAGSQVSWAYNWGSSADGLNTDAFEYVPMLWSDRDDFLAGWTDNAKSALSSGSKYILGFNEPDLSAQANMLPAAAATAYKTYITDLFGSSPGVTLGSPAVTNGGGATGLAWLSDFLDACTDCNIGFVAIHWYDSYSNTAYFKQHLTQAHEQTGLPVWLTEFGTTDGDDAQIAGFLEEVMAWMDEQDFVHRYSYFMASDGKLNTGSELSTYGKTYATYQGA